MADYDEKLAKRLRKHLRERDLYNYQVQRPHAKISEVSNVQQNKIEWANHPVHIQIDPSESPETAEDIRMQKIHEIQAERITTQHWGEYMGSDAKWHDASGVPRFREVIKAGIDATTNVIYEIRKFIKKIPVIGGLLDKALLAYIATQTGLGLDEITGAIGVLFSNIENSYNIGHDISQYGMGDALKKNLLDSITNTFNLPKSTLKGAYPDSVKSDYAKGIGGERMSDFSKLEKEHTANPTAEEKWRSATIAHMAYTIPNNRTQSIDGYEYDEEASDKNIAVYRDITGDVVIGIRGTKIFDYRDLKADYAIITKQEKTNELFKTTVARVERIIDEHNRDYGHDSNIYIAGHSLGGQLVNAIMAEPQLADSIYMATALAPGSPPKWLDTKWLDWILARDHGKTPQEQIIDSGHDVSHLHSYITGAGDILSKSEGDLIPGIVHYYPESGHKEWDDWDSLDWWEQQESGEPIQEQAPAPVQETETGNGEN